jgi:hypothetical protein
MREGRAGGKRHDGGGCQYERCLFHCDLLSFAVHARSIAIGRAEACSWRHNNADVFRRDLE